MQRTRSALGPRSLVHGSTAVLTALGLAVLAAPGCSSEELGEDPGAPRDGGAGRGNAEGAAGKGSAPDAAQTVAAALLPGDAALTTLYAPGAARSATALAFNPNVPGELWVTLRQFPTDAPCTNDVRSGCTALPGEVAVIRGADTATPETVVKRDGNAWHFMRRPTSIAFGTNGNFATCPEARTGNYEDEPIDFVGPTLWSSDPAVFGVKPKPGQNGTHLDMLHSTPFCMGIAHEVDNVYWAFNGQIGALDRYDFREPHVIGGEDHRDGELHRFVQGQLLRVPEIPSHLVLDPEHRHLYAADTGHGRIVRLDIETGAPNGELAAEYDGMPVHPVIEGAALSTFVPAGVMSLPTGLTLHDGIVLATDNADGTIHAFDAQGAELRVVETGLPPGALGGIAVGPDSKVYVTNLATGAVHRFGS